MKALLVNGSPKAGRNTSQSLGSYLLDRLAAHGIELETVGILSALASPEKTQAFMDALDSADLIVLATPLYVDSLPAGVMLAMEKIAEHRLAAKNSREVLQQFAAILNCGFPESIHNDVAIKICGQFAKEMGMSWAGGLSLGGGAAIDGKPLDKAGGMARNVRKSLDLAAEDLAADRPISEEARKLMSTPMMSRRLYLFMGTIGWKFQARSYKANRPLNARPYE